MNVPGSNILKMALTVIHRQIIHYYRFGYRQLNNIGQDVSIYQPPEAVRGSFQPVPRRLYEVYGLDLQKEYYMFYSLNNVLDIDRDISGDQIAYNGQRYQCESNTDWYVIDKWKGILCVRIGLDTPLLTIYGFNSIPSENTYTNFGDGNFIPPNS
jgi:hypothetical protein